MRNPPETPLTLNTLSGGPYCLEHFLAPLLTKTQLKKIFFSKIKPQLALPTNLAMCVFHVHAGGSEAGKRPLLGMQKKLGGGGSEGGGGGGGKQGMLCRKVSPPSRLFLDFFVKS
jgi:hypothetical protein